VHVQHHQVGVLDQLLHSGAEPGAGCTIDHSMIRAYAVVDGFSLLDSVAFRLRLVVDELSERVRLAYRDDSSLGPQDCRHEVATADVAHGRHAESTIVEVGFGEATIGGSY
jgi:hypothetical protein